MSEFRVRTVVFPTDFSEFAHRAGRAAADLARHFGAQLHVVHVDPPVTEPASPSLLAAAAAELSEGVDVTTASLSGVPARQICAYARQVEADLIVVGTHGRTGLSHALLGSVAEAVVRRAPCPVMAVPTPDEAASATPEPARAPERAPKGTGQCVVCATPSPDLVCEACRAKIRGEALERKHREERPGRMGASR